MVISSLNWFTQILIFHEIVFESGVFRGVVRTIDTQHGRQSGNTTMAVTSISSQQQIDKLNPGGITVLNFWADWSKQCEQTNDVFQKLAQKYTSITFAQVEAEKVPDVTEKYSVLSVPFFVFLRVSN
jgi:thiol-disulfide isomerase/thioredoxin